MANEPNNGRSWRPQDTDREHMHWADHTNRSDDDRQRTMRDDDRTMREDSQRMREEARRMRERTEHYGGGQSGYGAGRMGDDRSMGPGYRNQSGYTRGNDDDRQGMRTDDRFTGRGGPSYSDDRTDRPDYNSGYNHGAMGYGGSGNSDGMPPPARSQQGIRGGHHAQGGYRDQYGPNYGGNWDEQRGNTRVQGMHRGKGPMGYTRSDERIREQVCEALADDHHVDATHIEVVVKNGEVLLTGSVDDRQQKRLAEDLALNQSGVQDVQNQLRVGAPRSNQPAPSAVGPNETEMSSTSPTDKKARA